MPAIIAAIAAALSRFFVDKLSYYLAMKALIIAAMMILLPYVLKDIVIWIATMSLDLMCSVVSGYSFVAHFYTFEKVGGYLATELQLPLVLSVIISALTIRLILNFIPFVK